MSPLGLLENVYPSMDTQTGVIAVLLALILWQYWRISSPRNLPPGVRTVPILGSLPFLGRRLPERLTEYRSSLGDVFHVYLGRRLVIILNGYDCIKEAFSKPHGEAFSDRPCGYLAKQLNNGKGIVLANGVVWKEQRRFALSTLKGFGMGRGVLEGRILEEGGALCAELRRGGGQACDPSLLISNAVSNVICSMVFGRRYSYDDHEFKTNIQMLNENVTYIRKANIVSSFPWLRHVPGDPTKYHKLLENTRKVDAWVTKSLDAHRKNFNPEYINDFIDAYLNEMRRLEDAGVPPDQHTFNDEQLLKTVSDLFIAGTETTVITLQWSLLYMLIYPNIQQKVQSEIYDVIAGRAPSMNDRKNLPFTDAVLQEVQRIASVAPLGLPHSTNRQVNFRQYTIPKDTLVFGNLHSVFYDPKLFPEPDKFNPDRFLDAGGTMVKRLDEFIPFGIGKRVCPGESLARMELFLFFTSLLQEFTFKREEGTSAPLDTTPLSNVAHAPKPYRLCAITRKTNI